MDAKDPPKEFRNLFHLTTDQSNKQPLISAETRLDCSLNKLIITLSKSWMIANNTELKVILQQQIHG